MELARRVFRLLFPPKEEKQTIEPQTKSTSPLFDPHVSEFQLGSSSIDDARPMRVVAIGAGFSGIIASIRYGVGSLSVTKINKLTGASSFPQRMENTEFVVYEKNAGIGGTWYSNKYPVCFLLLPVRCTMTELQAGPSMRYSISLCESMACNNVYR